MPGFTGAQRFFMYRQHTDMRKGFDGLCGVVRMEFLQNPLSGDVFVFLNRRRTHIKLLQWQGDGFAVFFKRLEKGTYEIPLADNDSSHIEIASEQLNFILQGVVLKSVKKRSRYEHRFVDKLSIKSVLSEDL